MQIAVLSLFPAMVQELGRHGVTGRAVQRGHVALSCIDPASSFSSGTGALTAANGDQLFIAFENTSQPDPADPTRLFAFGPQRVTGGTGRFQNASGAQSCNFTIVLTSPSTGTIEGYCDGRLIH